MKQGATPSSGALSSVAVRDTAVIYAAAITDAQELALPDTQQSTLQRPRKTISATVARRPACALELLCHGS